MLDEVLAGQGYRDTHKIEEIIDSAKKNELDADDIKGFTKDFGQVSANGLKNTSDEIAQAYKAGKDANHLKKRLSTISNPKNDVGFRKDHIMNRHKPGAGKPGKTEFPADWNQQRILHNISDIAGDSTSIRGSTKYGEYVLGYRDGVLIRVELFPADHPRFPGAISSGFPINVTPNP